MISIHQENMACKQYHLDNNLMHNHYIKFHSSMQCTKMGIKYIRHLTLFHHYNILNCKIYIRHLYCYQGLFQELSIMSTQLGRIDRVSLEDTIHTQLCKLNNHMLKLDQRFRQSVNKKFKKLRIYQTCSFNWWVGYALVYSINIHKVIVVSTLGYLNSISRGSWTIIWTLTSYPILETINRGLITRSTYIARGGSALQSSVVTI